MSRDVEGAHKRAERRSAGEIAMIHPVQSQYRSLAFQGWKADLGELSLRGKQGSGGEWRSLCLARSIHDPTGSWTQKWAPSAGWRAVSARAHALSREKNA